MTVMVHPDNLKVLDLAIESYRTEHDLGVFFRSDLNAKLNMDECLIYAGSEVIDVSVPVMVDEMIAAMQLTGSGNDR